MQNQSNYVNETVTSAEVLESTSLEWNSMTGAEIYDRLCVKGAKIGYQANKMLRELNNKEFVNKNCGIILAKNKEERVLQRVFLANLSGAGLEFLREEMTSYSLGNAVSTNLGSVDNGNFGLEPGEVSANLRARVVHLAKDPETIGILEIIFSGVTKIARRTVTDDKTTRNASIWNMLCGKYFNNIDWRPENDVDDSRVSSLNPTLPPSEPYAPEKLRTLFCTMRTQYSLYYDRYHRSGQIVEGDGDGDDDFFENFVRGNCAYVI